jgi:hypothetical protein
MECKRNADFDEATANLVRLSTIRLKQLLCPARDLNRTVDLWVMSDDFQVVISDHSLSLAARRLLDHSRSRLAGAAEARCAVATARRVLSYVRRRARLRRPPGRGFERAAARQRDERTRVSLAELESGLMEPPSGSPPSGPSGQNLRHLALRT